MGDFGMASLTLASSVSVPACCRLRSDFDSVAGLDQLLRYAVALRYNDLALVQQPGFGTILKFGIIIFGSIQ
ncbi:hypothetical protein L1887_11326 [Cichorium endivia]|nr:hypothetical protein L1887_11326 [Cichorium endivia]